MKKGLLSLLALCFTGLSFAQDCSQLFISEYVEGWSNNKAIEIYNPTNATIDLSQYFLQRYSNGSTTASAQGSFEAKTIQLTGSVAAYSAVVFVIDMRDPAGTGQTAPIWDSLEVKADYFLCNDYSTNNVMFFNGNDAMLLAKGVATNPNGAGTVLCDVFGKIGQDPENTTLTTNGWSTVAPYNMTSGDPMDRVVTEDHSLIRKASILKGDLTPVNDFNALVEWDSIPAVVPRLDEFGDTVYQVDGVTPQWLGNWESLGEHTCNCLVGIDEISLNEVAIYPNPSNGVFFLKNVENAVSVKVINALGQEVKTMKNNANPVLTLDLDGKSGVYFVKLTAKDGQSITRKVIVK